MDTCGTLRMQAFRPPHGQRQAARKVYVGQNIVRYSIEIVFPEEMDQLRSVNDGATFYCCIAEGVRASDCGRCIEKRGYRRRQGSSGTGAEIKEGE